jgi:hypothetical protein
MAVVGLLMRIIKPLAAIALISLTALVGGCGDIFAHRPATLFSAPLVVDGFSVGPAIIDTGGGYEVMLRERFDLDVAESARVLAFGGSEVVGVTEGFSYSVGGWASEATSALVGVSVCDCNGIGFQWFRKTGAVLMLDFSAPLAAFVTTVPNGGVTMPFAPSPPVLPGFDTSFIPVRIDMNGTTREVIGLLDTGTTATVMRRDLAGNGELQTADTVAISVTHSRLGSISVRAGLFDTEGLPDIILGTDALGLWADRWYFTFTPEGGYITAFPALNSVAVRVDY